MDKVKKLATKIVCLAYQVGDKDTHPEHIKKEIVEMENALTDAFQEIVEENEKMERMREDSS